ncbi:MAG TPA: hypothetical protein VGQ83_38760 [Polyangia bacterium]
MSAARAVGCSELGGATSRSWSRGWPSEPSTVPQSQSAAAFSRYTSPGGSCCCTKGFVTGVKVRP